jgi:CHAT domain-containing protein/tetratricopeptide (TPR) repeat protein
LLVYVALVMSTCIRQWWDRFTPPASAQTQERVTRRETLEPNQSVSHEISSGQTHPYDILPEPGHYWRLAVTASGIGLRASLYDPDGRTLAQTACRYESPVRVSWIAEQAGDYRLEIEACETEQRAGHYQARVEESRPATGRDQERVAAERGIVEADKLRAELDVAASREALHKYQDALRLWRAVNDRGAEAETLHSIGEMLQERGERQAARRYFAQALVISRQIKEARKESRILNSICFLQAMMGDYKQALEACSRARSLSRAHSDLQNEALALSNTGEAYHEMGELRLALEHQKRALRIFEDLKDRRGQSQGLLRAGHAYLSLGDMQEAMIAYQRALPLFRAVKDHHGEAFVLAALGHIYSGTGSKQEALNYYSQAVNLSRQMEDPFLKAEVCAGIGYVYFELGEPEKALWYDEQALSLYQAMPDRWGEAAAHLVIGTIYHSMGKEQQALDHLRQGSALTRSLQSARLESYLLEQMGAVYEQLGQKQEALVQYHRALSLSRSGKDPRCEVNVLNRLGRLRESLGQKEDALNFFKRALPLTRRINDRFAESFTLFNIGHVQRDLDHLDEARAQSEAAIRLVESLRTNVASEDLRAAYLASVRQYYELNIDVLMRLRKLSPDGEFEGLALEASERAHARSLLDMLKNSNADIRRGVDVALLERERSLQQTLNAKAERQMRMLASQHKEEEALALAEEIDKLTTDYDEVKAQIKTASPHYATITQPQPLSLKEIQRQVLDDETLLLEYALGDERSYLWAVTRDGISGHELPGRAEIEGAARRVYDLLKAHQPVPGETLAQRQSRASRADEQYWQEATVLSRMALGPVAGQLRNKRLLIVADGALQYIPFGALTVPEGAPHGDTRAQANETEQARAPVPLIVEHEIVNLPSASTLAVLRKETTQRAPAPRGVAVLADPVFERDDPRIPSEHRAPASATAERNEGAEQTEVAALRSAVRDAGVLGDGGSIPRLMASRDEAEAIMQVTPAGAGLNAIGFDASRAIATNPELGKYRIVHFATHGLLNSEHPELSGVILSLVDQSGQPINGFLRLHDIYNLNLPADLVVLSACNTGLGKDVKGEGLIGLTRGFMYAGASGVMASLWKVDDEATAELMKHFYRGMLKDGLPPAAALRQAQMRMLEQKRWRSPYYWSAFVLQGEYRERIDMEDHHQASASKIVAAGAMVLVFSIGGGLYARKRRRRNAMRISAL